MKLDDVLARLQRLKNNDPKLTKMTLIDVDIDSALAKVLADALEENTTLTTLELGSNNIGDEGAKNLAAMLEKNQTLTRLDIMDNNISDAGAKYFLAALEKNQTLTTLGLLYKSISKAGAEDLANTLQNNFSLCEITGLSLPNEARALLKRNKTLQLVKTQQTAITALNALRKTLPIPQKEIQEKKTELNLSATEAQAVIQFGHHIGMLQGAIQQVETTQTRMAHETSERAQRVKKELQQLHDECVSEEMKLLTTFHDAMKDNLNVAIDSMVEHIPETSPLFHHARFLLFEAAYSGYQAMDEYSPTQALVEALPLLRKDDGTLLTNFVTTSKDIEGMLFKPVEQQRVFDSAVLAAAGHDVMPAKEIALTNDVRADLLRFALLRYAKDITTETDIKHSKVAGTLFAGTKKEIPTPLRKSLATLPSSFDVTKSEERENVRNLFDEAHEALEDLLSKKPKKTQAITDLKTCHKLMAPLSTKPITPNVSPRPTK